MAANTPATGLTLIFYLLVLVTKLVQKATIDRSTRDKRIIFSVLILAFAIQALLVYITMR
jgi:hypothetical protein